MIERSISPVERFGAPVPIDNALLAFHVFVAGETISGISHDAYDDWRDWRDIAAHNQVEDVRRMVPGTTLEIPARRRQEGLFERF